MSVRLFLFANVSLEAKYSTAVEVFWFLIMLRWKNIGCLRIFEIITFQIRFRNYFSFSKVLLFNRQLGRG